MADVRSLLRNERASRRITHPQASYSSTGSLLCLVCRAQIKTESLWNSHLHSTQHTAQLRNSNVTNPNAPQVSETTSTSNGLSNRSKKRKAEDDGEDTRKRTKPVSGLPEGFFDAGVSTEDIDDDVKEVLAENSTAMSAVNTPESTDHLPSSLPALAIKPLPGEPQTVDESEWAAFERDVATPPPSPPDRNPLTAVATISAAPLTAAEIAAREREAASTQAKERKEAELEGEKEDAARRLDEEFDEMEVLEARVRRLREMREVLRRKREQGEEGNRGGNVEDKSIRSNGGDGLDKVPPDRIDEQEDGDEDEDEDWDEWILR